MAKSTTTKTTTKRKPARPTKRDRLAVAALEALRAAFAEMPLPSNCDPHLARADAAIAELKKGV